MSKRGSQIMIALLLGAVVPAVVFALLPRANAPEKLQDMRKAYELIWGRIMQRLEDEFAFFDRKINTMQDLQLMRLADVEALANAMHLYNGLRHG